MPVRRLGRTIRKAILTVRERHVTRPAPPVPLQRVGIRPNEDTPPAAIDDHAVTVGHRLADAARPHHGGDVEGPGDD